MKVVFSALWSLVALGVLAVGTRAEEKDKEKPKEVTLKGTILCAKCVLKEAKTCTTAIQVKDGDKVVTYYLDDKGHTEPYHEAICGGEKKEGTVTGVVTEKDGKKYIKPSKVEYDKK
jgi:hypothetical protein